MTKKKSSITRSRHCEVVAEFVEVNVVTWQSTRNQLHGLPRAIALAMTDTRLVIGRNEAVQNVLYVINFLCLSGTLKEKNNL
jgi:hypothetical protein